MVLVIDNYDSFTYNLVQYLGELGQELKVVRNDAMTVDANSVSEHDIVANNCVWPNHAVAANLSIWTDDRGRMNLTRLTLN